MLHMLRGTSMPIIRSSRLYVETTGCQSRKRDGAASLFLDLKSAALHLTPDNQ